MEENTPQKSPQNALCMALDDVLSGMKQGDVPEWIPLLPKGPNIKARSGRQWTIEDAQQVIRASFKNIPKIPLDWNHLTEAFMPRQYEAHAAGWIVAMEERKGTIWGRVEWTNAGAYSVAERQYRYISAVFMATQENKILYIKSAALTNNPDLKLKALNTAAGGDDMKDEQKTTATKTAATQNVDDASAKTPVASQGKDEKEGVQKEGTTQTAPPSTETSLDEFVPRGDYDQLQKQHTALATKVQSMQTAKHTEQVKEAVDDALAEKKIAPASAEYHRACCSTPAGLERFKVFCAASAPLLQDDLVAAGAPTSAEGGTSLTPSERAMCANTGIDEKQFLASKTEQTSRRAI